MKYFMHISANIVKETHGLKKKKNHTPLHNKASPPNLVLQMSFILFK